MPAVLTARASCQRRLATLRAMSYVTRLKPRCTVFEIMKSLLDYDYREKQLAENKCIYRLTKSDGTTVNTNNGIKEECVSFYTELYKAK